MSGRDCIGIAKTGSGKTLAFVVPMLRHVKDQPDLEEMDGPLALIMAPTRELAIQLFNVVKLFTKTLELRAACVYGGAGVAEQIGMLKFGVHVIVCTPGRMIDLLCANSGRVTNLRRVTYVCLDEADRMFDMGFEPQIMKILANTRPDRQTVLFSATFPPQVEALAKKVLERPVEITVGGRSAVNNDVKQVIEVRSEESKMHRLLQLLGVWYEKGHCLVFVDKQDTCDEMFSDLLRAGYPCLSLHGGKDQADRDTTINDFKNGIMTLMIATSVAARGLDVKELCLVVNYDV
jgi:ATP-dependent RNA helicase DDX46/PRP5